MKSFFPTILICVTLTFAHAQKQIGIGVGYDCVESFNTHPSYSNKDINLNFSNSWNDFTIDIRQGLRYMEYFNIMRYNTYALLGFTSPKGKRLVFDILAGPVFSFANIKQRKEYSYYPNQVHPAIKAGIYYGLSKEPRFYIGLECLLSTQRYINGGYLTGGGRETSGYTGSLLVSLNYQLPKKSNKK